MDKTVAIEDILEQIKKLDDEARMNLMERLSRIVKKSAKRRGKKLEKLTDLNALGSEIWENINIEQYVQHERQWD